MAKQGRERDGRPDPDALLALSHNDSRGRLKVFLGAAPGVGKTYAMLEGARRLKADGVDVVIGIIETHGRKETMALVEGLESLSLRRHDYYGRTLEEFDIDAALERQPKLLVVDELAHSNVPDSRHPKRWQDVEELLKAGINVWTALNIQHLESLADIVSRITGVAVRETVPDTVLQNAADVVLVDITPEDLIARLNEGKVYVPEVAQRATQNFFTTGNLTALRELALRRTADRVDDEMMDFLRQKAIEGPWGAAERLLVCIGADAGSERVVRRASQLATGLNATWIAVHIERPGQDVTGADTRRITKTMQLADRLGGEVTHLNGGNFATQIIQLARRENVTQIVIGHMRAGYWKRLFGRSLPDELVRLSEGIEIHVVASDAIVSPLRFNFLRRPGIGLEAIVALGSVTAAVAIGELLATWLRLPNLSMVFLGAVLFCAVRFGIRAAILASLVSFLAYNFFFIEPIYSFSIAKPHELLALLIFLCVAVFTGSLAGRLREQSQHVLKRAAATQSLYEFSRNMSGAAKPDDVLWAAAAHMHKMLGRDVVLLVQDGADLKPWAAWPPNATLDTAEASAANWALRKSEAAGWATGTLPNIRFQFRPLVTARGVVGVCGFEREPAGGAISAGDERMLTAILDQTAIALDRAMLAGDAVKSVAFAENERVRDALLASLSHDLKTPLASITGAVTTLRQLGDQMPPQAQQELLASIEEETARLSRFLANLLDMSRIESGAIKIRRDWVDAADAIRAATARSRKAFADHPVQLSIAPDLGFIRGDAHLLEQVLFNLIDNANKYGGPAGAAIHARRDTNDVVITVTDEGPGIKPGDLERIFEKFWRGGRSDGRSAGTGLGLSICRGLVNAMGGTIFARSPAIRRRGTRIVIRFPLAEPPAPRGDLARGDLARGDLARGDLARGDLA